MDVKRRIASRKTHPLDSASREAPCTPASANAPQHINNNGVTHPAERSRNDEGALREWQEELVRGSEERASISSHALWSGRRPGKRLET